MEQPLGSVIHIHFDRHCAYQKIPKDGWERIMARRWWYFVRRILRDIQHSERLYDSCSIGISPGGVFAAKLYAITDNTMVPKD